MKARNLLALIALALVLLAVAGCIFQTQPPEQYQPPAGNGTGAQPIAKAEVINSFSYVSSTTGFLKAFAEVKNTGEVPVKFVGVAFHYIDSEGNPAESAKLANVTTLEPGDTSPASVVLATGLPEQEVTATIKDFTETTPIEYKLIKAFNTELKKPSGYAKAIGYAKNNGTLDWQKPFSVFVAYYDATGNIVETGTQPFPFGLKAGESKDFSNTVEDDSPNSISYFKAWVSFPLE